MSYFFFLYWSPSLSLCMVLYSILSNLDEILSINTSANVFVFGDFNIHHKDWLTYSGGTDWQVNSVIIFLSQMTLLRKFCRFLCMFLTGSTSLNVSRLFPLSIAFFVFVHVFYFISSNIDEILSISTFADVFVFGDFNVHHKDWVTNSGGTDWPGELCYNFSI